VERIVELATAFVEHGRFMEDETHSVSVLMTVDASRSARSGRQGGEEP
jgi:hypothetical protein